jgi:pilus assembly protein Flp/PilA
MKKVWTGNSPGGDGIMLYLMSQLSVLRTQLGARERGQGMVEYGLIIAAVAIAVIIALFALGPKIGSMFSSTAASLQ